MESAAVATAEPTPADSEALPEAAAAGSEPFDADLVEDLGDEIATLAAQSHAGTTLAPRSTSGAGPARSRPPCAAHSRLGTGGAGSRAANRLAGAELGEWTEPDGWTASARWKREADIPDEVFFRAMEAAM